MLRNAFGDACLSKAVVIKGHNISRVVKKPSETTHNLTNIEKYTMMK